jgi:tRNA (guanine-N1)-methyltransferase
MNSPWQINILTLFPELFPGPLSKSVTGRGLEQNLWSINTYNIRDYANNKQIKWAVIVGENELNEGKVMLKNLETGDQSLILKTEIIKYLN